MNRPELAVGWSFCDFLELVLFCCLPGATTRRFVTIPHRVHNLSGLAQGGELQHQKRRPVSLQQGQLRSYSRPSARHTGQTPATTRIQGYCK